MKVLVLAFVLVAAPLSAQQPVNAVPDVLSYATSAVNPAIAVYQAFRSEAPQCKLTQLAVSEAIVNGGGWLLQRFVTSPRPCVGSPGCNGNGMPSLHAANSAIGASSWGGWRVGFGASFAVGTAGLRVAAHRHTTTQAALGVLFGTGAELAGQHLVRCGR